VSRPEEFTVKRAERKQARLRLGISSASNGGKTWTAIELGFGLAEELLARGVLAGTLEGKVGVVDTERKSAQLYAHLGPFDTVELDPPYSVERYVGAMQALERAGVAVIILDSISHAWDGAGGVLALLDRFQSHEKFSAFGTAVKPAQNEFVDAMLRSPCHVIATMRSKTAWVLEDTERRTRDGGVRTVKEPRRIGLAPIQRPGIEYEFTTLLDLDTDSHCARVVKNRCPVFQAWSPKVLTREHGRQLAAWLLEGALAPAEPVSGSPLERAEAVRDAALRAIGRAATVPDLAVVFERAQRDLRAFPPSVPAEVIRPMLEAVVEAKDLKKDALRPGPGKGPVAHDLPPGALERPEPEVPGPKEVLDRTIEKVAKKRGGLFADMKDDVPF
jgi:AAA domain-containing protein